MARKSPGNRPRRPEEARSRVVPPQAPPRVIPRLERPQEEPLTWLEGLQPSGVWVGVYCTRDRRKAKVWLRLIIGRGADDEDSIKEGLDLYDDFRLRTEAE